MYVHEMSMHLIFPALVLNKKTRNINIPTKALLHCLQTF